MGTYPTINLFYLNVLKCYCRSVNRDYFLGYAILSQNNLLIYIAAEVTSIWEDEGMCAIDSKTCWDIFLIIFCTHTLSKDIVIGT